MPPFTDLRTRADAEAMLAASHARPVVLFKHSAACGASARMQAEVARLDAPDDPPRYVVVVQHARDVSEYLAARLGVRHETPQALVLHAGTAVLALHHGAIHAGRLRDAARAALSPTA
jgi:thioredoxin 1